MKKLDDIEFLIFDFGNVIIDINYDLTINKLKSRLENKDFGLARDFLVSPLHFDFETGKIGETAFRNGVRDFFQKDWEDNWIDEVWNSLLLDIPRERMELLQLLKKDYPLYLLSNTNSIHIKAVEEKLRNNGENNWLGRIFDEMFLSHQMGMRKPEKKIYQTVVDKISAEPEKCLFFDDLVENLSGAKAVGLKTHLISHPKGLLEYFSHVQ